MASTRKKKKKKTTKKSNRTTPESKSVLKTDSGRAVEETDNRSKIQQIAPKKSAEKRQEKSNKLTGYIGIAIQFLRDARTELKKVKWPTRKELIASTVIVIVLILAVAIFLGLIDFGLMRAIEGIVGNRG